MKRAGLVGLLLLAVLTVFYLQRRGYSDREHARFQAGLGRLKHMDSAFNEDLLRVRFSLLESYDVFQTYQGEMDRLVDGSLVIPGFVGPVDRIKIDRSAKDLAALLQTRRQLFERFKSLNAVLSNSRRYFPVAVDELTRRLAGSEEADRELGVIIQNLTRVLLTHVSSSEPLSPEDLATPDSLMSWSARHPDHKEAAFVVSLAHHARTLLAGKNELDALTRQLLSLPTSAAIEQLSRIYEEDLAGALRRTSQYQALLYGLVLLLAGVIGYALWALRAANQGLEQRVGERTQDLQRENAERKRAQEATAREKERLKFIFDTVPMGIALATENKDEGVMSMINEAHLRICGLTREEADVPANFTRISHPEDRARQQQLIKELNEGRINQFSMEKRYIRPDGQIVWVVFSLTVRRYADGSSERLTTVVDITDLKRAQEQAAREHARFKLIFESIPVGISWRVIGVTGSRMINPAHERITGVSAAEAMQPDAYERATHPDDYHAQKALIEKYNNGEIDRYSIEKRYLHPEGRVVWAVLSSRMSVDPATGQKQSITTLVDITERKQAELDLENLHKRLLDVSRQAGMAEVATGVLHNVGNVLNSVNVSATLVADQVRRSKVPNVGKLSDLLHQHRADLGSYLTSDPKGKIIPAYLVTLSGELAKEQATIIAELDSLHKNIGHIKDIVAMQQNYAKTSGVVETVSVPDLIEDALHMNAGSLARHDVDIAREYHVRPVVTLEKNKALQILVNLVRNAKYACDESGRIDKLLTIRTTADDHGVTIAVIDNGVGIPPENLTRIFAHGFTTRKHGHGFGLHSGALAAKELGGSLVAHSDGPGHGASFTLKLPYKPESPPHEKSAI